MYEQDTSGSCPINSLRCKAAAKFLGSSIANSSICIYRTEVLPKEMTPYEAWTGEKPLVDHLQVFGWQAYAHVPKYELNPKSRK
jgi:hypothetical protein